MIGMLKGKVHLRSAELIMIDVQGVGYELVCPLTTVEQLPEVNQECLLYVKTRVRDDQITLFGFSSLSQRKLFEHLTSVSGVGPRLALACLSGMTEENLTRAIINGEVKRISSVPGIGKRTADRIILELRPKFEKAYPLTEATPDLSPIIDDLQSALLNLGYPASAVNAYLEEVRPQAAELGFDELLRGALSKFAF
jgi:Holliday junction DNA helicase RuvA